MKLPGSLGSIDFGKWAYGLIAAFIGGGSGAFSAGIASMVVDPHDFNIYTPKFWQLISTTFVVAGLTPFFAYLHQEPLPKFKEVTTTTKHTEVPDGPDKIVTTVKEVQQVPITPSEK